MTVVVRERSKRYASNDTTRLLEADLWRLWEGQRFPKAALVTAEGSALRVIFRGRPGAGPGPDFRGAMISTPSGLLSGDVELHVRTSDFRRHGHHLDPSYANIALHVVFFHDEDGKTALPGGSSAPVLALGGLRRLADWLERPARWGEPCRDATGRMTADGLAAALDRLGAMRFRQKTAAWVRRLAAGEPLEEALWSGLLEALAYGGERMAFRRLAAELPWVSLREALLGEQLTGPDRGREMAADFHRLGADWDRPQICTDGTQIDDTRCHSGQFDGRALLEHRPRRIRGGAGAAVRTKDRAVSDGEDSTPARALSLFREAYAKVSVTPTRPARPGNGADTRLAGAAALAARFAVPGLAASLIGPLAEPEGAAKTIVAALTVPRLVGRSRAIEIAGNAVLPLAAALCDEPAVSEVEAVFGQLTAPARYGPVRHLHSLTSGVVPVGMRRQQGMLYLLHQYCTQGGCGKCPLS